MAESGQKKEKVEKLIRAIAIKLSRCLDKEQVLGWGGPIYTVPRVTPIFIFFPEIIYFQKGADIF